MDTVPSAEGAGRNPGEPSDASMAVIRAWSGDRRVCVEPVLSALEHSLEGASELPPPVAAKLRSAFLSIFPTLVFGSDATTWIVDGIAKRLIALVAARLARWSLSLAGSATWAGAAVTNTTGRCPQRASAMPITAACR